ncbi:hypothetical protein [Mesorhizobium sp. LNJC391B00]|uniref:hypothetical protein n=1 Tax=Mesorhizobium sp. LNJC391B00 TaxID=1287273 RepID=UPI0003CE709F|nr:hypothetical protein [Mesorhizobium sp. LNJC391B00]ESY30030.1 hypothetical protein X749_14385 [Mesorhizobium sp. LNJC391B00]
MITARDQLTAAHKSMTKTQIAENALLLADELERMHYALGSAVEGMNAAAAAVGSFEELVRILKADIRTASNLFQSGRKRAARELLARMAAVPDLDQITLRIKLSSRPRCSAQAMRGRRATDGRRNRYYRVGH